jgi:enoyl-CoA hydratase
MDQLTSIAYETTGRVARITLNRAERGNGITLKMQTRLLGASNARTFFDGVARHTREGYAFQRRGAEAGFEEAVRERDEQFGDPSFE